MTNVLCIGEVMAEFRRTDSGFAIGWAGDTFNTAVYCSRALGAKVAYLTRVGIDPLSDGFLDYAGSEALDLEPVTRDPDSNLGIYSIRVDAEGERSFHYWRSESAARKLFQQAEDFDALAGRDLVYFSGITLAILAKDARSAFLDRLDELRRRGQIQVAFDSNYRPSLWTDRREAQEACRRAWEMAHIALPSLDDEQNLFEDRSEESVVDRLHGMGVRIGALKRGARGPRSLAFGSSLDGTRFDTVKPVDSTAAGDSFNGAYMASILRGEDVETALGKGHALASEVVRHPGAIIPV